MLRFTDTVDGSASLALREGDPDAVEDWADHHRIHPVTPDTAADQVFTAWAKDVVAGANSIMIAPTLDLVTALNARARQARLLAQSGAGRAGSAPAERGPVSTGDSITTKRNDRSADTGRAARPKDCTVSTWSAR